MCSKTGIIQQQTATSEYLIKANHGSYFGIDEEKRRKYM